jgi:Uma2 family endonuclease
MATITRRIGPADHGQRMTLDEFIEADFEEGWLYELAREVIDVTEVPGLNHGRIVGRLTQLFIVYAINHAGVINYRAGGGECRLRLPRMQSDRHPNQVIYLLPPPLGENQPWTEWVPTLAVEVVSRGGEDRDYIEKREEYLRVGVTEYWILDPIERRLLVLKRFGDLWKELIVQTGTVYRPSLLPGLEVRPEELPGPALDE